MKILRFIPWIPLVAIAIVLGFRALAATQGPENYPYPGKSLMTFLLLKKSLSESGQTNMLSQIEAYYWEERAEHYNANIADTVAVLERLRSGRTNEVFDLLESKLDTALVTRSLMPYDEETKRVVEQAREYRTKFPHKLGYGDVDRNVTSAFEKARQ